MSQRRLIALGCAVGLLLLIFWVSIPLLPSQIRILLLPNYGTTTDTNLNVINRAAQDAFFAGYEQRQPGQWRKIRTTVEGHPISTQVYYLGGDTPLQIRIDTSSDPYGSRSTTTYICTRLIRTAAGLVGSGCSGSTNGELPIP